MTTECTCGCNAPGEKGFDRITPGQYKGRGAGYLLKKLRLHWTVVAPNGAEVPAHPLPLTLDEANLLASRHARENGHGHP